MTAPCLSLYFCDQHHFPLPAGHKFPLAKYRKLRDELSADPSFHLQPARFAGTEDILRVHGSDYIYKFLDGTLDSAMVRRIGFPWSQELVWRTLASVGGTLEATRSAIGCGFGGTLAGGTHHAYRDEGSGFCVFNDIAVAIEWAKAHHGIRRFGVVDLDVHQGDGTAAIFQDDPRVFTLSLHGERNFPFRKQTSVLDVPLPDGIGDEEYLKALGPALRQVWKFRPELIFFQSGVDGLAGDRLGRLALTKEGLAQRDLQVLTHAFSSRTPLVLTLGGGYAEPIELTVAAHAQSFRLAAQVFLQGS